MKKQKLLIYTLLLLLCVSVPLAISCSSDDDEKTEYSLDGTWVWDDGEIVISGSSGKFETIKYGIWEDAIEKGFITIGSEKIKNIKKTGDNQWTCSQIAACPDGNGGAASVFWADDCTISISEDGNTIIVKGYLAPCGNSEGREATATYTRKK